MSKLAGKVALVAGAADGIGAATAELLAELVSKHPIGFLGDPVDVARGILYLASDDARFVTGSELVIDGGFSL